MYTRPWTPEEDARLHDALYEGATQSEIGEELGRTRPAVAQRAKQLGLRWPMGAPVNPYRRAQILAGLRSGLSHETIGRQIGVKGGTVQRTIVRLVRDGVLKRVIIDGRVRYLETTDKELRRVSLKTQARQAQAQAPADQRKHSA